MKKEPQAKSKQSDPTSLVDMKLDRNKKMLEGQANPVIKKMLVAYNNAIKESSKSKQCANN